jgi:hypothetical protein
MNGMDQATTTEVTGTPVTASVSTTGTAPVTTAVGTATGESFATKKAEPATAQAAEPKTAKRATKLSLSQQDFNERIKRAKTSAFKDAFGTDDVDSIKQRLARAEELEKQAEEARVARMNEVQRAKYEAQRARREAEQFRTEVAQMREREVVRDQQSFVERVASRHVNPMYMEEASIAFAREVANADPREVARWTEKDVSRWFASYVAKKPAFAASPNARKIEKKIASAPTPPPRPQRPGTSSVNATPSKTFKPGQPNSMTREEARAEAKRRGYTW